VSTPYRFCPLLSRFDFIDRLVVLKIARSHMGIWTPIEYMVRWANPSAYLKGHISIASAVFATLIGGRERDRQTDHANPSVGLIWLLLR